MIEMSRRTLAACALAALVAVSAPAARSLAAESEAAGAPLSPDDVANVVRVEQYQARFVQISSDGNYAEGEVHVSRPGNLRFDYDPPATALLIATGSTLLYYDKELKQASFIPLWETPLWFFVGDQVSLGDDLEVISVEEGLGTLSVAVREKDEREAGQVTLVFSDSPLALKKWEVLDPQGVVTQVSLINPQYGVAIDEAVFDYHDLEINRGQRRITE
jgi:outer membrane lipoprotein-sorting protein